MRLRGAAFLCVLAFQMCGVRAEPVPPPPKNGGVYVVAHRGAHQGIPENTLAAYRKAIELGADFVEVDLRTTQDGHIVSVHNRDIDRYVRAATGPVTGYTLQELKAFDIGSRVGPEWKNERVPTFEEILELCQGKIGIYVDMKSASVELAVGMVREFGMTENVVWYSDDDQLDRLAECCPECLVMPDPGPAEDLEGCLTRFAPRVLAPVWREYPKSFVDRIHETGAIAIIDERDKDCWEETLELGFDGIQTDYPGELVEYLKTRARPLKRSP